jgi:creatinine amidohydrolase
MGIDRRAVLALLSATAAVAPGVTARAAEPAPLEMRNMTWLDIKSAIAGGATTVIVPTGGIEQNGPHMVLGKHDTIVASAALRIARDAGQCLVAPVVSFVPQGEISPPTGNMLFPGTIGISETVFESLLEGIAQSLKHAGFKDIAFIGDHGMSQPGQKRVAERLSKAWGGSWMASGSGVRAHHLDHYYDDRAQIAAMTADGETEATIGQHAGLLDTSELMSVSAPSVDLARLAHAKGNLPAVGASGDPARATLARGAQLLKMRTDAATLQLRALLKR